MIVDVVSIWGTYWLEHPKFLLLEVLRQDFGIAVMLYAYFISVDPLPRRIRRWEGWLEA
jgi:hypothetical protein